MVGEWGGGSSGRCNKKRNKRQRANVNFDAMYSTIVVFAHYFNAATQLAAGAHVLRS
jgi:hypothetical protein